MSDKQLEEAAKAVIDWAFLDNTGNSTGASVATIPWALLWNLVDALEAENE